MRNTEGFWFVFLSICCVVVFSALLFACGSEEGMGCETVLELQFDASGNPCTDGQAVVPGCCPVDFTAAGVVDGAAVCVGNRSAGRGW